MSTLKYWISIFSLVTIGAGCGDDGGGSGNEPDASTPNTGQVDAGGGADASAPGVAPSCTDYCGLVMTNCTGDNEQYPDMNTCLTVCEGVGWDVGLTSDQDIDSLGCRAHHADELAAGDPATHCPHAGPSGGNVCGTWCDVYCALNLTTCTGRAAQYPDEATCLSTCAGFRDDGDVGYDMGDTVQCRIYHSGYPAVRDPQTACPYTGPEPGNYCIDAF